MPSRRNTRKLPIITSAEIVKIIRVAMALISGETPNRILEKITIGSVELPGPLTKLAITKSSKLRVNDNSQAAIMDGRIRGRMIDRNTNGCLPPRSLAASSRDLSISRNLV